MTYEEVKQILYLSGGTTMAEYIERAVCLSVLRAKSNMAVLIDAAPYFEKAAQMLEKLPTADVAPVVHGQWIIGADNDDFDVKCSKCEWADIFEVAGIAAVERIAKAMHYCLNCGARMDGVVKR